MSKLPDPQAAERLDRLVKRALAEGADAADAVEFKNISVGVSYRLGKLEDVGRSESSDLGLRVFVGRQVAFVSSTDFSEATLGGLPARAVAMAKLAPEDKFAGLAPRDRLAKDYPEIEIDDPEEPSTALLVERAHAAEAAALEVPGITNSEGGSADYGRTMVTLATSEGFLGGYAATSRSVSVAVIAGEGTSMERDYDYAHTRFADKDGSVEIHQQIVVGRDSQKPIVLGKRGARIKAIGEEARKELSAILGVPVHLYLHVKVDEKWSESREIYDEMGLDWVR